MKIPKLTRSLWMAVGLLSLPVGTAHADLKPMSHTISIDPSSPTDSWEVDLAVNVSAELTANVASTGEKGGVTYNLNGSPTASITGDQFQLWTGDMSGNSGTFTIVNTGGTEAGSTVTVSCVWSPTAGSGSGSGGPSNIDGRAIGNADIGGSSHVTWTFVPDPPIAAADGSSTISWTASFSDDAGLPLSVSVSEVNGASLTPATAVWNINPTSGGGSVSTLTGTVNSTTPSTGNLQVAYDDGTAQSDTSTATLIFAKVEISSVDPDPPIIANKPGFTDDEYGNTAWLSISIEPAEAIADVLPLVSFKNVSATPDTGQNKGTIDSADFFASDPSDLQPVQFHSKTEKRENKCATDDVLKDQTVKIGVLLNQSQTDEQEISVKSVFRFLEGEDPPAHDLAISYVAEKYDISQPATYDEGVAEYGETDVFGNVRVGPDGMSTENVLASTLIHEKVHVDQGYDERVKSHLGSYFYKNISTSRAIRGRYGGIQAQNRISRCGPTTKLMPT